MIIKIYLLIWNVNKQPNNKQKLILWNRIKIIYKIQEMKKKLIIYYKYNNK